MDVRCQCGSVHFKTPAPAPLDLWHCHCRQCQRQSSSAFGTSAIFLAAGLFPLAPELDARLVHWTRPASCADSGREMDCWFCRECGARVMHRVRDEDGTPLPIVSVKGGLIEGLDWSRAKHIFARCAVVPIPDGAVCYDGEPKEMPGRPGE